MRFSYLFATLAVFLSTQLSAQGLLLQQQGGTRQHFIKPGDKVTLYFQSGLLTDKCSDHFATGTFVQLDADGKAQIKPNLYTEFQSDSQRFPGMPEARTTFAWRKNAADQQALVLDLDLDNLVALRVTTRKQRDLHTLGKILMTVGFSTALVAAPLASYNFKDKSFQTRNYGNLLAAGLGTAGLGVLCNRLSLSKTFALQRCNNSSKKEESRQARLWEVIRP